MSTFVFRCPTKENMPMTDPLAYPGVQGERQR